MGTDKPLAIVSTFLRETIDLEITVACVRSIRETASDRCEVIVVDDGSPAPELVSGLARLCEEHEAGLVKKERNEGFSTTVNVGLRKCLIEGRDAVLVSNDVRLGLTRDWLGLMKRQRRDDGRGLASIVGALLLYPNGLIQHGGMAFSPLTREFDHRFRFGPGNLPEAMIPKVCPVTGALLFIRHECLEGIGLFDEAYKLGWEVVDYNLRAWLSGRQSVYQPAVQAIHHDASTYAGGRADARLTAFRHESWRRFHAKYTDAESLAEFAPADL